MNREQIEHLLNRYLDGETTNQEEQLLRQYFASTQIVPPEWKAYKALFGWESSQRHAASSAQAAPAPRARRRLLAITAAVAAAVVIGAGITLQWLRPAQTGQQETRNYAILDGRYITDQTVIAREAEEALLMVSATDEDTFDAIDMLITQ